MGVQTDETASLAIPMAPVTAFDAIANGRRRHVLLSLSLSRTEDALTVGDLAVEIAAIENEIDPSQVSGDERTSVYISLIQSHLDTLDEAGAIDYDRRSKTVAATDATESLAEYIRRLQTTYYKPNSEADA
ncbi:hypothetical protein PNP85_14505 [Halobacterium salinarum]|uniref:DUF7344 domain-containing protein n=1 Tax=Halobacterium salinarum TaxID=2242 RepID=UPI00255760B8|nr:hypothetical protein [Halobacterium salinarum]MDL0124563.1 hypothetical protein [Halobacterium salinarum]MDL0135656.1 hypothetical protein [Halobacterium salinarum]MDL0140711.1 hypothetical protein [Halobacterium salinarum]